MIIFLYRKFSKLGISPKMSGFSWVVLVFCSYGILP